MKTLLSNCTAVLMDEPGTVLPGAFLVIEDETILSVGTDRPAGPFDREIDAGGKICMPGFVDAHTHVPMTLMRGYAGGHDLQTWLNDYIFPAEDKLDGRSVRAGTDLAMAELIASGVTCLADMYYFCDDIIGSILDAGISANIARGLTVFTPDFDFDAFPGTAELKELVTRWHGYNNGQILIDSSIHGEYTSYPAVWEKVADYTVRNDLGIHVHVSETRAEHEACRERWGLTPIQALDRAGVWDGPRALAAHCVWTEPEDWEIMRAKNVTCVHNPVSNLKLGSGIAPIPAMQKAGVNVALGTDGVSSNNSHDMLEEIKLAAILHCGAGQDPLAVLPMDALRMATVNGARALGRKTGVLQPGYTADLILLDTERPEMLPCHSVTDNIVYSAHSSAVCMTMARGKILYQNGEFLTIDMERVRKEVRDYALPHIFG